MRRINLRALVSKPDRDVLGRRVREVWIAWARTQPSPKASWFVEYDLLSEPDKEADRMIGEALWSDGHDAARPRRIRKPCR